MKFFRKIRKSNLKDGKIVNYLKYAIGEIILVVIGILLAVYINERITEKKNNDIRDLYLNELKSSIEYDIKDVQDNISGFNKWNPKLKELLLFLKNKKLTELDSVKDKINIATKYIFFIQRSKSKIEELTYSNINLIKNRELKNKILLYQDSDIMALKNAEKRYNLVDAELRRYFSANLINQSLSLKQLEADKQFSSLIYQKYNVNAGMNKIYQNLLKEQYEIKKMIESELENHNPK
jgi:hypothetical protein